MWLALSRPPPPLEHAADFSRPLAAHRDPALAPPSPDEPRDGGGRGGAGTQAALPRSASAAAVLLGGLVAPRQSAVALASAQESAIYAAAAGGGGLRGGSRRPATALTPSASLLSADGVRRPASRTGGARPLLGWAEAQGLSIGRAPRQRPLHFEGGLERLSRAARRQHPALHSALSSSTLLSSAALAPPPRWTPQAAALPAVPPACGSRAGASGPGRATQPPSPPSVARAARALS